MTHSKSLDNATDNGNKTIKLESPLTAPNISQPRGKEATDEAPSLKGRGDVSVEVSLADLVKPLDIIFPDVKVSLLPPVDLVG